ncbi:CLUMA_CG011576, isoform A [Clunio marinus]|uniref:CLUMA_CG011576, isoform A n=1 Tax=Clunio marinus TaxID=568069 RepID=A0A1J1ID65_9DIPT|nr:CLUMA_CG011576, isoform A [Clunio marinus]
MNVFQVLLITFIVSVEAKSTSQADNAAQPRSLKSEMYVESSVANDNICNNHEKNVAFDVILFEKKSHNESKIRKKRQAPYDNRIEYKNRPRSDQKSLVIVFDATGSMHDDLEQLRAGAKQIVTELSARDDNPIFNYILVVYRDPTVEPAFQTKNPDDLLAKLKQIQTIGGGDCAEYALTGLKVALQLALPNSLAYVFSDATAKDLAYYEEVLGLIQKKQATVNFLLTGDCDDPAGPGYQVYVKLSRASNGQVYDMNKSNVKDVLLAIRHTVNYNYAALTSVDADSAGTSNTKLNVDKSISELSVSLSGKNPRLTITDPMNETVKSGEELSLMNLKLVKIKDPVDGLWNVETEAESSHSIRLGGISDLKFDFGFSTEVPEKKSETSFQPLASVQNILSIFVIDPSCHNHSLSIKFS